MKIKIKINLKLMSSKKNSKNKNLLKNYFEEINPQRHLKIYATEANHQKKNKKIYLNCLNKENPNQNNINTVRYNDTKKKSFSLYKNYANKNPIPPYKRFISLSNNKNKSKIILNCDEMNNKKNQIKLNLFMNYHSSKKILSNGSTRKSSDASPPMDPCHQTEIANFKNNYKYCTPNLNQNIKNEHIILKNNNNEIKKYKLLKKNIFESKNSNTKNKGKEDIKKIRKSDPIKINLASSAKQNNFLSYNQMSNANKIKCDNNNNNHNSFYEKQTPTLKLFDNNASSSSDSDEEDEEDEESSDSNKYENLGDNRKETELIMDTNFKISDDELSDELIFLILNK